MRRPYLVVLLLASCVGISNVWAQTWFQVDARRPDINNADLSVYVEALDATDARQKAARIMQNIWPNYRVDSISVENVHATGVQHAAAWSGTRFGDYWYDTYVYNLAHSQLYQITIRSKERQFTGDPEIASQARLDALAYARALIWPNPVSTGGTEAAGLTELRHQPPIGHTLMLPGPTGVAGLWYRVQAHPRNDAAQLYTFVVEASSRAEYEQKASAMLRRVVRDLSADDVVISSVGQADNPYTATYAQAPTHFTVWFDVYLTNVATREGYQFIYRMADTELTIEGHPDRLVREFARQTVWRNQYNEQNIDLVAARARPASAAPPTTAASGGAGASGAGAGGAAGGAAAAGSGAAGTNSLAHPSQVQVSSGPATVTVTSNAVEGATGYRVRVSTDAEGTGGVRRLELDPNSRRMVFDDLRFDQAYFFAVQAYAGNVSSAWSPAVRARIGAPFGDAPTPTVTPRNGSLYVSWPSVANVDSYNVRVSSDLAGNDVLSTIPTPASQGGVLISPLNYQVSYVISLQALHPRSGYESRYSPGVPGRPLPPITTPDPPQVTAGVRSVTVRWVALENVSTGYRVRISTNDRGTQNPQTVDVSVTTVEHTFTGLTAGTTYFVAIQALRPGYSTPWSQPASGVPTAPVFQPTQPTRPPSPAGGGTGTIQTIGTRWNVAVVVRLSTGQTVTRTYTVTASTEAEARTLGETEARKDTANRGATSFTVRSATRL